MLLVDAGNTRIKWAFAATPAWQHQDSLPTMEAARLGSAWVGLPAPASVLVSNVAGPGVAEWIVAACKAWDCRVEFVSATAGQCGVTNGYDSPGQLGSDRWAALLAAWDRVHAPCLVVNCGTATTVDALTEGGRFPGGLILPGIDMMRVSLSSGTSGLALAPGQISDFPRNTADAIFSGAVQATVGAIRQQHARLGVADAPCLLGGGAAGWLQPHLGLPMVQVEDLVLKGLQLIALDKGRIHGS